MINFPTCIRLLEEQNQWEQAIYYLLKEWKSDQFNLNKLLCASTEIWFVLVFFERLEEAEQIDEQWIQSELKDMTDFGFQHFPDEMLFNLFFGYMIILFPYYFDIGDNDYDDKQQLGSEMCLKALQICPNNPVAKIFCRNELDDIFSQLLKEGEAYVCAHFPEDGSEVIQYYRRILSID